MNTYKGSLFKGAASEIITPFKEDGTIATDRLRAEVSYMIENGVTGIFVNGLASEALMMNTEDRNKVARTVVATVGGTVPVMGNIICNSLSEGLAAIRAYEELNYDALSITPPLVYKYDAPGISEYCSFIAKNTDLPVYIYNAPESGNKLSPQMITELVGKHKNIIGVKDSTQNIIEQQQLIDAIKHEDKFELIAGSDAQIVTTMFLGGTGVISLITTLFPRLIVELCQACVDGQWDKANDLQQKVLRVRSALKIGPFMAAYKFVAQQLGRSFGVMKKPLSEVNENEKVRIKAALEAEGLL